MTKLKLQEFIDIIAGTKSFSIYVDIKSLGKLCVPLNKKNLI